MLKQLFFIFLFILGGNAMAQMVTVTDNITQQTIPGVFVFSKDLKKSGQTNAKGQIEMSAFKNADSIQFTQIGFTTVIYSYEQLTGINFRVVMPESPITLNDVVVSASRWEDENKETPNRIEKIKMRDVAFLNPQTSADLLATSGYAFIQKSQMAGGSPMLRGMATNRVLIVVDGVRMNNAIFRSGNLQNVISIDANNVENAEILFGPGSLMYGSDAIGGVMDFHTLTPNFSDSAANKKAFAYGNAMMRTSTANSEKTEHLDFNIGFKKWSFITSFTHADYGNLRGGSVGGDPWFYRPTYVITIDDKDEEIQNHDSTLQIGSEFNQTNFMQKVRYKANKYLEFDYGFHLAQSSPYNRYDRLYVIKTDGPYKEKLRWAEWYYGPQKWNMNRIGINYTKPNFAFDHLRIIGAMQKFEESRYDREFMVRELRMQQENVNALSLNIDLDKSFGKKLSIVYGTEVVYNKVNSIATLTHVVTEEVMPTVTRYPDGSTWESYGVYLNAKYKFNDKIVANGGVRYSHYAIRADFDTTYFPFPFTSTVMNKGNVNGSIGFVFTPIESWVTYINFVSGYRAPNIDDMGKVFESTPGYMVVPNPDLKPENMYNMEIGTAKTFGNFLKIDVTAYYSILNDAMVRRDFTLNGEEYIRFLGNRSKIQALQNVAQVRVYGIQAGVEAYFKGFGLKSTISYQSGKEQSSDSLIFYPLRHAAPTFGSTHLSYSMKVFKFDFYVDYNGKMDYENLALTERVNLSYAKDENGHNYVASWYTLNFKAAFYMNQYVSISLGIENIEDRLYRPYSSGISAPGRNIIAALRVKF